MIKYILHPGNVISKNDGQEHFITYPKLIELYNLDPKECTEYHTYFNTIENTLIHLYPREDGNYVLNNIIGIPENKIKFILHPGEIVSQNDGQSQLIQAYNNVFYDDLLEWYDLKEEYCINFEDPKYNGSETMYYKCINLYPLNINSNKNYDQIAKELKFKYMYKYVVCPEHKGIPTYINLCALYKVNQEEAVRFNLEDELAGLYKNLIRLYPDKTGVYDLSKCTTKLQETYYDKYSYKPKESYNTDNTKYEKVLDEEVDNNLTEVNSYYKGMNPDNIFEEQNNYYKKMEYGDKKENLSVGFSGIKLDSIIVDDIIEEDKSTSYFNSKPKLCYADNDEEDEIKIGAYNYSKKKLEEVTVDNVKQISEDLQEGLKEYKKEKVKLTQEEILLNNTFKLENIVKVNLINKIDLYIITIYNEKKVKERYDLYIINEEFFDELIEVYKKEDHKLIFNKRLDNQVILSISGNYNRFMCDYIKKTSNFKQIPAVCLLNQFGYLLQDNKIKDKGAWQFILSNIKFTEELYLKYNSREEYLNLFAFLNYSYNCPHSYLISFPDRFLFVSLQKTIKLRNVELYRNISNEGITWDSENNTINKSNKLYPWEAKAIYKLLKLITKNNKKKINKRVNKEISIYDYIV